MHFITVPFRNLVNRPVRSVLTGLGIAVAVGSLIALVGMSRGLELAWINSVSERGTDLVAVKKGSVEILTASLDEGIAGELSNLKGVKSVAGELVDLVQLETGDSVLLVGWGEGSFLWNTLQLSEGSLPGADRADEVVIGRSIAEKLEAAPGETMRIHNREFRVAGIFKQKGVMSNNSITIPLKAMQDLLQRHDKVTQFNIRIDDNEDTRNVQTLKGVLHKRFAGLSFQETGEMAENNEILKLLRAVVWGVSVIALVMALVIILNTLLMSVTERTREIGTLMAVGWSKGRILLMFVLEGLLLSFSGSAAGALIGIYGLRLLAEHPRLQGFVEIYIPPSLLLEVSAAAVLLGLLGSLLPAWRAAGLNTLEALRYE
ncbi:MAG: ABC transporter permease [Nitrospirota bacterium]